MKSYLSIILAVLALAASVSAFAVGTSKSAFVPSVSAVSGGVRRSTSSSSKSRLNMIFGPKDDGSPGDYVCLDCGYVFTKGPEAWKNLPNDWSCPPCGSVKRRFKKVPKGSVKDTSAGAAAPKKKGMFGR